MDMCFVKTAERALDPKTGIDFSQFGLILVRGVSGSGKSTMAQKIKDKIMSDQENHFIANTFETDSFFNNGGVYKFDPALLGAAHRRTQNSVRNSLLRGNICVVANTFTRNFEISPYFMMASEFDWCDVCVVDMYTQFDNVHGVPLETIEKQKARFVPCNCLLIPSNLSVTGVKIYGT